MNSMTIGAHPKLEKLNQHMGKKVSITTIDLGEQETETGYFHGFSSRGIYISESPNDLPSESSNIPFIGYDSAVLKIEDQNGEVLYDNQTEDLTGFYSEGLPTFFEGADGEGIVEENNRRVNAILSGTFGMLYPKLEMVK